MKKGFIISSVNGIYWNAYAPNGLDKKLNVNYKIFDTYEDAENEIPEALKAMNQHLTINAIYYYAQ